jgi:hypothetical protein
VGTSGAYGGSNSGAWKNVRDLWADLDAPSANPTGDATMNSGTVVQPISGAESLGSALAKALLGRHASSLSGANISLASVLPGRGASGGGASGTSRSSGRPSSRRNILHHAARGGAAIGAASAYRNRDAATLREFGIELKQLDEMSPRNRCAAILDLVLGEAGHPDEQAIRRAAIEEVKKIMNSQTPQQSAVESIRDFIGSLAIQIGMVELGKKILAGTATREDAARKEGALKQWVASKMRTLDLGQFGTVKSSQCHSAAYDMAKSALRLMGAM